MTAYSPEIHPWNQALWQQINPELSPDTALSAESVTDPQLRSNHALLLCGDKGLGKRQFALALAFTTVTRHKNANESQTSQNNSDQQGENLFNAASHPDFHVLVPECNVQDDLVGRCAQRYLEKHSGKKPKTSLNIEQIRSLKQNLNTHPHIAQTRVILIYDAQTLNRNAANALLKSLEEPPSNTLFILVCDELSQLPSTIRSRCSLVSFRTPETQIAQQWLSQQNLTKEGVPVSQADLDAYLAMASNNPLLAVKMLENGYKDILKSVFGDVNSLWANTNNPISVAKNWQSVGADDVVDILQKMVVDLLRYLLTDTPQNPFFPIQQAWLHKTSRKLSKNKLLSMNQTLSEAKTMLNTTVDGLLVLESVATDFSQLPQ